MCCLAFARWRSYSWVVGVCQYVVCCLLFIVYCLVLVVSLLLCSFFPGVVGILSFDVDRRLLFDFRVCRLFVVCYVLFDVHACCFLFVGDCCFDVCV